MRKTESFGVIYNKNIVKFEHYCFVHFFNHFIDGNKSVSIID